MSSPIKRVLIVDDHDAIRRGVRNLVESSPYYRVVGEASDGISALGLARETNPEIAILDYSLPGMNGLDLAHLLRREFPRIEMLLYTMHDREEIILEALQAGVRALVLKSEAESQLIAALDALSIHRPFFSGTISETLLDKLLAKKADPKTATSLTRREREVVQQIAEGRINREIAETLLISIKTVETHRASAMHKLGLHTTADLVRYAIRNNIAEA